MRPSARARSPAPAELRQTRAIPATPQDSLGDGNNDVEMFAEVTLAVAVANATPRARAAAAHVLPVSNDEDAVAEAIYTHLLSDS